MKEYLLAFGETFSVPVNVTPEPAPVWEVDAGGVPCGRKAAEGTRGGRKAVGRGEEEEDAVNLKSSKG